MCLVVVVVVVLVLVLVLVLVVEAVAVVEAAAELCVACGSNTASSPACAGFDTEAS